MSRLGLKKLIKRVSAKPLSACGVFAVTRRIKKGKVAILSYHRVVGDDIDRYEPGMAVSSDTFTAHMQWLSSRFQIIDLVDYTRGYLTGELPQRPCAVVTFDDGWLDNYQVAFPIMKRFGICATIFLATDYIDSGREYWTARAEEAIWEIHQRQAKLIRAFPDEHMPAEASFVMDILGEDPPLDFLMTRIIAGMKYNSMENIETIIRFLEFLGEVDTQPRRKVLNWEEIRRMFAAGMKFGSHSTSHAIMTTQSASECSYEASMSMKIIQDKLGYRPECFAYPNGDHNEVVVREVRRSGYSCAVTVNPGFANLGRDLYTLPRFTVHEGGAPSASSLDYLLSGLAGA